MKVTQKMIEEGWKKNKDGVWVAPVSTSSRKERVLLVETRQEVGSDDRTNDSPTGSTKTQIEDAQLLAYQRVGMSREEAKRAVDLGSGRARFNKG